MCSIARAKKRLEESSTYTQVGPEVIKKVRSFFEIPKGKSHGFCGFVSVGLYDELRKPADIKVVLGQVDKEPHVFLLRDDGWVIDPTADQFGLPFFTPRNAVSNYYHNIKVLSKREIQDIRYDGSLFFHNKALNVQPPWRW